MPDISAAFRDALIGQPLSHSWRGYGSAIFLEFGQLTPVLRRDGTAGNPDGEVGLGIEWSWRFERHRSILGGSWSSEARWPRLLSAPIGQVVTDVLFTGVLPEIVVYLSGGYRVHSFMTESSQPAWFLILKSEGRRTLSVSRGRLRVDG
jgi:hypothetical protein